MVILCGHRIGHYMYVKHREGLLIFVFAIQEQGAVFLIVITINNMTSENERRELKNLASNRLLKFLEYQCFTMAEHIELEHYK